MLALSIKEPLIKCEMCDEVQPPDDANEFSLLQHNDVLQPQCTEEFDDEMDRCICVASAGHDNSKNRTKSPTRIANEHQ